MDQEKEKFMSMLDYIIGGMGVMVLLITFGVWFIFGRDPDKEDYEWPTPEELRKKRGW